MGIVRRRDGEPDVAIVSYPRSGNTWVRYMLEFLSGRATLGHGRGNDRERPLGATLDIGVDLEAAPIARKLHRARGLEQYSRVVHVIRDPLYAIPRHTGLQWFDAAKVGKFDTLTAGVPPTALRVFYEDLIADPVATAARLCDFLEVDTAKLAALETDLEAHQKACSDLYERVRAERRETFPVDLRDSWVWVRHFMRSESAPLLQRYTKGRTWHAF